MTDAGYDTGIITDAGYDTGIMAELYLAWGWSVFPLWWVVDGRCACPRGERCTSAGKHPLTRRGVHEASSDLVMVRAWWLQWPLANVGLPAGANGLAVIDVDPRHGGAVSLIRLTTRLARDGIKLDKTLTQSTGGGGQHFVFTAPEGGVKGGANCIPNMPGIDVRGRGGYIVAAPSMHASGQRYEWVNPLDRPMPWPTSLTELMTPDEPVRPTTKLDIELADQYARAALAGECQRVREAVEGTRNHTLNRAAFALGQLVAAGLIHADLAGSELARAAADAGLDPVETRATIHSGLRGGAAKPRGGQDT